MCSVADDCGCPFRSTPTLKVSTRIEAYSCKPIAREKKLFKELEADLISDLSHSTSISPPSHHPGLLESAFGPLDQRTSRKTLWQLIGLLNVAFPDHDFSKVRPEEFRREDGPRGVLTSLSSAVDHLSGPENQRSFSSYQPSSNFAFPSSPFSDPVPLPSTTPTDGAEGGAIPSNPFLRQILDPVIDLADCEVFSYTPDMDSDPHAAPSDDESDDGDDGDAFERDSDDGGMTWEMDGIDGGAGGGAGHSSGGPKVPLYAGPSWYGGPTTPMKTHSFSSLLAKSNGGDTGPATPTAGSVADSEDYFGESSTGGLLWSTNWFLFNKKKKRILFVSVWARAPEARQPRYGRQTSGRGEHPERVGTVHGASAEPVR